MRARFLRAATPFICTALLTIAGPATTAFSATTIYERECQSPWSNVELLEHLTLSRHGERTPHHCQRREHHAPTGSCAGAPESRAAGLTRHWNPRALADAHRQRNGFGGPLRP